MNYLKYFQNYSYKLGENDCWTFTQQVFKDEKGIVLPDLPVINDTNEGYIKTNVPLKRVNKASEGCLVFVKTKDVNHAGYAISDKEYIHKSCKCVLISLIPKTAEIYEVLK